MGAGASGAIPLLVGIWLGHFSYGLIANMGGFTYLYAGNEPYARRGRKLLAVMIGLAISFAAGSTGAAVAVWCAALVLGLVAAVAVVLCEALNVAPPSAYFFILTCAIGTSAPATSLSSLLLRMGLILLGGIPAWLIAMAGWLIDPQEPEAKGVAGLYRALAALAASLGTEELHAAKHQAALAMRAAGSAFLHHPIPRWRPRSYERLIRLSRQAEAIFLALHSLATRPGARLDPKLAAAMRTLADGVGDPDRAASLTIPKPASDSTLSAGLYGELVTAVAIAAGEPPRQPPDWHAPRGTWRAALAGALDWRAFTLHKAFRFGLVLIVAYLIAYRWNTPRPYWVFMSTAAVMMGTSTVATLHRAVQRTVGTTGGVLLGALLLSAGPPPIFVGLAVMLFQVLAELLLVRNYGFAVTFVTPLGMLITHAGHPELATTDLVYARLLDILLGCALGLAGTMLFQQRPEARRIPLRLSEVLREEGRLLASLLQGSGGKERVRRQSLRTSLLNLRVAFDTGMIDPGDKLSRMESLWPAVIATERLGLRLLTWRGHPPDNGPHLADVRRTFDGLVSAVELGRPPTAAIGLTIPEHPEIDRTLAEVIRGLQVLEPQPS